MQDFNIEKQYKTLYYNNNMLDKDTFFKKQCDVVSNSNDNTCIILGDSIQILKSIKDKSVDLIFADPPYNIGKDFGNNKDKWNSVSEYIEWCKKWINECTRI